jgi:hypothetical protein
MAEQHPTPISEDDFQLWLREVAGVEEWRRIVRDDGEHILLSKFEEGFAPGLHELLALMPELFDLAAMTEAHEREAAAADGTSRMDAWLRAMHATLRTAGERHSIPDVRQAEVRTGIDSAYAILQTFLWSDPKIGEPFESRESERSAYLDATRLADNEHDMFTRVYGWYEDRQVVNHCPGAPFARIMLEQGWRICSGEDVPAPEATDDR